MPIMNVLWVNSRIAHVSSANRCGCFPNPVIVYTFPCGVNASFVQTIAIEDDFTSHYFGVKNSTFAETCLSSTCQAHRAITHCWEIGGRGRKVTVYKSGGNVTHVTIQPKTKPLSPVLAPSLPSLLVL